MKRYVFVLISLLVFCEGYAQQTVGLFLNDSTAFNGYTLIAPLDASDAYLVDNCGEMVNAWTTSTYPAGASVYLLEDGSLLRSCSPNTTIFAGGFGGRVEKYTWDDNLIWAYDFDDINYQQHHDIEPLPNGNILILAWDRRTYAEAIAMGLDSNFYNGEVWSEKVMEIEPIGSDSVRVVWEWFLWDHLVQDFDSTLTNYGNIADNRQLLDLNFAGNAGLSQDFFHANSVAYNPDLDQIIISCRNYSEFWVIDHSTTTQEAALHIGGNSGRGGDILYRWGNPLTYGLGDSSTQRLYGQHDAHWIPNKYRDGGNIIVFNNGFEAPIPVSTVEIIAPSIDSNGHYFWSAGLPNEPKKADWTYTMPLFVDYISGANRLPNGNTLICSGPDGNIFEVDSLDNIVWKYVSPVGLFGNPITQGNSAINNSLFRAYKYGTDYPAFTNRELTPQGPIENNPLPSTCVIVSSDTSTTTNNVGKLEVQLLQNPIYNTLQLENRTHESLLIQVISTMGNVLLSEVTTDFSIRYDVSKWADGVYYLIIKGENNVSKHPILKITP